MADQGPNQFQPSQSEFDQLLDKKDENKEEKKEAPPQPEEDEEHITKRPEIDYRFLDGLRGCGAFAVYLNHFMLTFYPYYTKKEMDDDSMEKYQPPEWMRKTPVKVLYAGQLWVQIFFILSGFVLPMNFFKTGRATAYTGGAFRRYLRLMIPVLVTFSLMYFFLRVDAYGDSAQKKLNKKMWTDVFFDGLFGVWIGGDGANDTWTGVTWTLGIELIATFWVYLTAQTLREYQGRQYIYLTMILTILLINLIQHYKVSAWNSSKLLYNMPFFLIGTALCDMEFLEEWRPLDYLRFDNIWLAILRNCVLGFLFLSYGMVDKYGCLYTYDNRCFWVSAITIDRMMPWWCGLFIGTLAMVFLVLLSDAAQWVLKTPPFQFMGRISYMLYLLHELLIQWCMVDFYGHYRQGLKHEVRDVTFDSQKTEFNSDDAIPHEGLVLYNFLIFTPVLILISWLTTWLVDDQAKNFAYELDVQCRLFKKKPPKDGKEPEEDQREPFWYWFIMNWKVWAFFGYFFVIITVAEIVNAAKGQPVRYK